MPFSGRFETPKESANDGKSTDIAIVALVILPPRSKEKLSVPLIVITAPLVNSNDTALEANVVEKIVNPSTS